eukprot:TRINITY_DN2459_c0_g2_i3.p1 TRINITY_DN2459_c0_g2~~TRINITY_DN2459_c0_g2_i3.p1  ORF type:complete len:234 (+),score=40.57 TRINITY_DN2459_c0_g2_i3:173-874(+)
MFQQFGVLNRSLSRTRLVSCFAQVQQAKSVELKLQHILLQETDRELMEKLQIELKDGLDFDSAAKEHSICRSSSNGGYIGWIQQGTTPQTFDTPVFNANIGDIVSAQTQMGIHLVKILAERQITKVGEMSVEELSEMLCNPEVEEEVQLVDVREEREYEIAKLPRFKLYPMSSFSSWVDDLDEEKQTIVLCHHGVRSYKIASLLLQKGFENVKNVTGGLAAYSFKVDRSIPQY